MTLYQAPKRRLGRAALQIAAVSAVLLSSIPVVHAGDDIDDDMLTPSWSDKLGKSFQNGMTGATKWMGMGKPQGPPPVEAPSGCPTIAILDGTQSQRVLATGASDNQGVRYQFSLFNVGRECTMSGGRISLRVGAGGRVLLGPAGAPGHFDVPIRVVVYSEVGQKPIESKLYRVSASIQAGQTGTNFQFASDNIVVPGASGRDFSIKVGFDSKGTDVGAHTAKVSRHSKHKPVEAAAAQ